MVARPTSSPPPYMMSQKCLLFVTKPNKKNGDSINEVPIFYFTFINSISNTRVEYAGISLPQSREP